MRSIAIACGHTIDHTPGADVAAGDVLVFGDLVAVADRPLKSGELGALAVDGLRSFPKAVGAGTDLTVGTPVYWDAANQVVTATAGVLKRAGLVAAAASITDTSVQVLLGR